jgi:Pyruvate/2-oxoacid:ferredoxin oxidoreductase gamma subunit
MLGAAATHLGFSAEELSKAITDNFSRKGDQIVEANLRALAAGMAAK